MKRLTCKYIFYTIVLFVLSFSCKNIEEKQGRVTTLPFYNEATFTPHWFNVEDEKLNTFHKISDFELVNQEGKIVTQNTFKDKIYIADFFFTTCPGICPKMTANMKVLQDEFLTDDSVLLLSHTVTPETDSVSVLKAYAEDKQVDSDKWHLVTGERSLIYDLGRQAYFVEEDLGKLKTKDDFLHTENFVLIDKRRHIRGIYNGLNKTAVQQLIEDIKALKKEG
ncbi:SCO family protein [Hyunsoonleella pacifica]|uniref:SCO family protein n=1 Tax=Hyunsoonleella pacifica TaxID=1080224 RepID=A0A4Q9FNT2_9FLAO|nr:SCO family protein [Hyunsoonleella pacifica]TBN15423.1 SCO family protein [Hyunsoonleella pacifica]GGD23966.1 SCO family protein [Hyunsoonleella pacifica]